MSSSLNTSIGILFATPIDLVQKVVRQGAWCSDTWMAWADQEKTKRPLRSVLLKAKNGPAEKLLDNEVKSSRMMISRLRFRSVVSSSVS